jgi:hypothetical protein
MNKELALPARKSRKRLGRRSLLTPALQRRICQLLAKGNTIIATCDHVGIGEKTYYDWCEARPQFALATSRARGKARAKLVKVLTDASKIDWRAAGWLLSHCWPGEYTEQMRHEVGLLGGIVLLPAKTEGNE